MAKKHIGKCSLCGKECELTFEHIPPRAAFNSTPARPVTGLELLIDKTPDGEERMPWDTTGLKYSNQQKGMGKYSLCQECNNNTGSWYGDAYVDFARAVHSVMRNEDLDGYDGIGFKEFYPLRFIKQVLSMFCSINGSDNSALEPIRKFVLDKEAVGIDKSKYKICCYFTKSTFMKYAGMSVLLRKGENQVETMAMSEITAYPLGFILYFNPTETWNYQGIDITVCADYEYNDIAEAIFPWRIEEMNDMLPEHFRSQDEIRKCIEENKKWAEEHDM